MNDDNISRRTALCNHCDAFIEDPGSPTPPHILRSDHTLTGAETTHIRALIEEDERLLKEYEESISWHRNVADKVERARKTVEERLRKRRVVVSALRRLPVEVWDEIFSLACQTIRLGECDYRNDYPFHITDKGHTRATARSLSLVCAAWRQIITSRPRLWAAISFDIHNHRSDIDVRSLLRIYFKYSATAPLEISIWDSNIDYGTIFTSVREYHDRLDKTVVEAYQLIFQHISRCAKLELQVNWQALSQSVTGISDMSFPLLHSLSHDVNVEQDQHYESGWFWRAVRMAPNLTCVFEEDSVPSHFGIPPYTSFTKLRLGDVYGLSGLCNTLCLNPRVEVFSVRGLRMWNTAEHPQSAHVMELPSLRDLKIYCGHPMEEWLHFVELFRMPVLNSLWIGSELSLDDDVSEHQYHTPPASFTSKLHHFANSLQFLSLHYNPVYYNEPEITNLVKNLPNLVHFRFTTFAKVAGISLCTTHFLASLQVACGNSDAVSSSCILAPKLERLEIREFNFCPRSETELVEKVLAMASSRSASALRASGLEKVASRSLSRVYLWWKEDDSSEVHALDHDSDSEDGHSTSESDSDNKSASSGHLLSASTRLHGTEPSCRPLLYTHFGARIEALERDGTICSIERKAMQWCDDLSVGDDFDLLKFYQ
ncbi:hypothetical protein VNI00_012710 [Paramarasmius palmivorus]|uniref:F-box domain-containing protein n=1 Tax=Paramarasmius palmivorus TaxID=297713 RepID=A0AAW0C5B8_9AGAR